MTQRKKRTDNNMPAGKQGRLLIFIVAYNAERTIESVLKRIPSELLELYEVEVLIIDDSSQDDTFVRSELARRTGIVPFEMTVLFNPVNQGYGGNQKIGFHYAIENNFDWVALVHGDGQYAPECLPELVEVLAREEVAAVFGSRMMQGRSALKGGMPLYKFAGNKILTGLQNFLLKAELSEFHSGYRLYATDALAGLPFDRNSNDFHFDTEIIIQLIIARFRIKELPIPTFYGDEICHVNGLKYAWDVCRTTLQARVQKYHIFYDRKFDCAPDEESMPLSLEPFSAEAAFLRDVEEKSKIFVMGKVSADFLSALEGNGHHVTIESRGLLQSDLKECRDVDYLLILDDTDLSRQPESFIDRLRDTCRFHPSVKIVIAVGNIGFFMTRILLLFGRFSYTRRGVISLRHYRLFTLRSLKKLFSQNGFEYEKVIGIPVPYSLVFSSRLTASLFAKIHQVFVKIRPSLFSYQFLVEIRPKPSLEYLLARAVHVSREKQSKMERETKQPPIQQ